MIPVVDDDPYSRGVGRPRNPLISGVRASDGKQALTTARAHKWFSDIEMPGMKGLTCSQIRTREKDFPVACYGVRFIDLAVSMKERL
jgi:CheY-like chemotaxis protein